jgi:hypothetical protein
VPKLIWLAGSSVDPAPSPIPERARLAVLAKELLTVSGVERAPGTAGVKLEPSMQSVVLSAFVTQLGVPNDHSVEVKARLLLEAGLSPALK